MWSTIFGKTRWFIVSRVIRVLTLGSPE